MIMNFSRNRVALSAASTIAGIFLVGATSASAGECPAGNVTTDGQKAGATVHKDVTKSFYRIKLCDHALNYCFRVCFTFSMFAVALTSQTIRISRMPPPVIADKPHGWCVWRAGFRSHVPLLRW